MFNSMTPPPVSSYGEPCCLRPLPSQGPPSMGTEGQCLYQSLSLEDWQISYQPQGSLFWLLSLDSFPPTKRLEALCNVGLAYGTRPCLGFQGEALCVRHSSCLSSLGLSGLPFCHHANLMSGPHSYGPARETNSCTEGEASGNISPFCPSGICLEGNSGRAGDLARKENAWRWA